MKVILPKQPLSNQHIYLQRWRNRFMIPKAKELKQYYIDILKQKKDLIKWKFYDEKIVMQVTFYHWDLRIRDIDNYCKLLLDSFEEAEVIKNDNNIIDLHLKKFYDKENPRTDVVIHTLNDYKWFYRTYI